MILIESPQLNETIMTTTSSTSAHMSVDNLKLDSSQTNIPVLNATNNNNNTNKFDQESEEFYKNSPLRHYHNHYR